MKKYILFAVLLLLLLADAACAKDSKYTEVVPPKYDEVGYFSEGLVTVRLGGKWGHIGATGKEDMFKYDDVYSFSEGFAVVRLARNGVL